MTTAELDAFADDEATTIEIAIVAQSHDPEATGSYDLTELAALLAQCLTLELEI